MLDLNGATGEIRTPDLMVRSHALYPTELRSHTKTGGERGIRTLDGLLTHTPLAGARLRPLGHLSGARNLPLISQFSDRCVTTAL